MRKKIAFLALEQEKLARTPVQQMLNACHFGIKFFVVVLCMTVVNLLSEDLAYR